MSEDSSTGHLLVKKVVDFQTTNGADNFSLVIGLTSGHEVKGEFGEFIGHSIVRIWDPVTRRDSYVALSAVIVVRAES